MAQMKVFVMAGQRGAFWVLTLVEQMVVHSDGQTAKTMDALMVD